MVMIAFWVSVKLNWRDTWVPTAAAEKRSQPLSTV